MAYIQGVGRTQGTLFPVTLEELISADHVCRVMDAFVSRLDMDRLGLIRAEAAETGWPGYDPLASHAAALFPIRITCIGHTDTFACPAGQRLNRIADDLG